MLLARPFLRVGVASSRYGGAADGPPETGATVRNPGEEKPVAEGLRPSASSRFRGSTETSLITIMVFAEPVDPLKRKRSEGDPHPSPSAAPRNAVSIFRLKSFLPGN